MTDGRLRLTILGGFLGSGKTTWLRHQLHEKTFGRVHVIVNEAADAPVDDAMLGAVDNMTLLAGACACCDGKEALRRTLLRLCNDRSATGDASARLENIVLETSGLADPAAILAMIQSDPILVRQIVVSKIIVIADAVNALDQMRGESLSRKQIEAADALILTKVDRAGADHLATLRATLRAVAPGAVQTASAFGSAVPLPAIPLQAQACDLPPTGLADSAPIQAITLDLGAAPDWTAFTVWLSALLYARGDQIVRVKGVVRTPAGRLLLQSVRRSVQSPEILPPLYAPCGSDNTIAVIGRGFTQAALAASLERYSG